MPTPAGSNTQNPSHSGSALSGSAHSGSTLIAAMATAVSGSTTSREDQAALTALVVASLAERQRAHTTETGFDANGNVLTAG